MGTKPGQRALIAAGVIVAVDMGLSWLADPFVRRDPSFALVSGSIEYGARAAVALALFVWLSREPGSRAERLGLRASTLWGDVRWSGYAVLLIGALVIVGLGAAALAGVLPAPDRAAIAFVHSPAARTFVLGTIPITVVLAPAVEEVIYRGILMPPLLAAMGPWKAIALDAALFAFLHAGPYGRGPVVPIELLGGAFVAYAFYARRSVTPGILLHAVGNAALMMVAFAHVRLYELAPAIF